MKKFFLLCLFLFIVFNLYQWLPCFLLKDHFYFSPYAIYILLDDAIHNDISLPFVLIRVLHNKPVFMLKAIVDQWLSYWDIKFLFSLITPVGFVGLIYGLYSIINSFFSSYSQKVFKLFILILITLSPFLEIFKPGFLSFHTRLLFLAFVFITTSVYGWFVIINKNKTKGLLVVGAVSLWISLLWGIVVPAELRWMCR